MKGYAAKYAGSCVHEYMCVSNSAGKNTRYCCANSFCFCRGIDLYCTFLFLEGREFSLFIAIYDSIKEEK